MKKLMVVFILLVFLVVGGAVWFSPFAEKKASVYGNNVVVSSVDGLCYAEDACVRYDTVGSEDDMYRELSRIRARVVKTATAGDAVIVYAYSDRVCKTRTTSDGEAYNVMAAYRDGAIAIGAPVLQGSY